MSAAMSAAAAVAPAAEPVYRHYRQDFGPLLTRPLHLDLEFDIQEDRVRVTARTTFLHTVDEPLKLLKLNSKDLEIESVEFLNNYRALDKTPSSADFVAHVKSLSGATATKLDYTVDTADHFLNVDLSKNPPQKGQQFVIRTVTVAKPTAHILEGLYYDYTPEGQPKTIITQCQQYGFQRIVPSLDYMTSKSYYTTRILADARYTHLISNGDLAPGFFDEKTGLPVHKKLEGDDKRVLVEYHNHLVNMASYLFFLGVGTYQTFRGEFEYCNGQTAIAELLVFPKLVEDRHARTALQALIDSIMWCYLSTGPEATEHTQEREKIYQLIPVRDALKARKAAGENFTAADEASLASIRAQLKELISVWKKTGYAYTGQIYREISMQNSDYGGMENVGNTTIVASRMVPSDLLPDVGYVYSQFQAALLEGVKIHEYYHNINGSQVTGESPFEIWLNEAVTVYIQRQRENALFGADYMRLKEVLYSFTPGQGPLAIDAGPTAMPIEPKGFNRTQELISCFPSTDHQVLTSLGWMYLSDVQSHFSTAGLLHIACHELDGTLVYKPITPADVVVQEGQHVLVDISVSSTNLSLRPTANHVMYGQLGWMDNANHWMPTGSTAPTERHFAADLVASVHNRPASDGDVVFRPPAYFAQGVATSSPLPFAQELGLTSSAHVKGFLQFYGFFLGSGHWTPAMQLQFTIKLSAQREVFREIMSRTPLQENTDWTDYPDQTDKGHRYVITNVAWNTVLFRLHGHGQQVNRRRVAVAADPDDDEADDQRHWIAEFAFTHLNKKQARYVLEAMRQARNDGSEAGHQQIGVRSERFKNDLERLMIHAGYSVTIDPNGAYGFKVQYSDDAGSALPIVRPLSHVTPMEYVGTVWCVTVPAPNLIMFRRVAAEDEDGNVLKASRGVIVGNSTTYSKAPEFVNMIESLIGTATFNRGLDLYHTKYSYANATTNDWIRSMEETSGKSLMKMADLWLRRNGHPHVVYSGEYDATKKEYTVKIEQQHLPARDPTPWIVPIDYSLVKDGRLMKEGLFVCEKEKDSFTITDVSEKPDFLSFARGWSFFGTHSNSTASVADLSKQALTDPDIINRYFAYRAVVDAEKGRIIDALVKGDASHVVSPDVAKLHAAILFDSSVTAGARAAILREGEDIHTRPDLSFRYWEISNAKQALLQAVFDAHGAEVLALYQKLQSENRPGPHIDQLHQRALKHHLFTILAAGVNKKSILSTRKLNAAVQVDISALAKDLLSSSFMTDKLFAFSQFLSGPASSAEKQSVMEQVKKQFSAHPDSIESYIGVITGLDSEDAPTLIRALLKDALFDVNLAGHARTAVRMWAGIRKRSLLTDDGLALTGELFLLIGRVNQYSAQSFISALNDLAKFEPAQQKKIVAQFRQVLAGLDQVKEQSLFNQLSATLSPYKEV